MVRRDPVAVVAALVVLVLAVFGPLSGIDVTSAQASTVGDGNATVESTTLDAPALTVTDGRFGATVQYVRLPVATVTVESVTGRPRLVYLVSVPELGVERAETHVITRGGTYRLAPDDRALGSDTAAGTYEASLTLRVQSFETAHTVARVNHTVAVPS